MFPQKSIRLLKSSNWSLTPSISFQRPANYFHKTVICFQQTLHSFIRSANYFHKTTNSFQQTANYFQRPAKYLQKNCVCVFLYSKYSFQNDFCTLQNHCRPSRRSIYASRKWFPTPWQSCYETRNDFKGFRQSFYTPKYHYRAFKRSNYASEILK